MRKSLFLAAATIASSMVMSEAAYSHGPKGDAYSGHAHDMGEPGDSKARARTIEITMTDEMRFKPGIIMLSRGDVVRFVVKNTGALKHEFVLGTEEELTKHAAEMEKFPDMEHDDPNAVSVEPGQTATFVWKFTKAGTWEIGFACLLPGHFTAGMKGKLVVR